MTNTRGAFLLLLLLLLLPLRCNGKVACKLLKTATNSLKQLAERQKEQQLANDEVSELPVNISTKLQLICFHRAHGALSPEKEKGLGLRLGLVLVKLG